MSFYLFLFFYIDLGLYLSNNYYDLRVANVPLLLPCRTLLFCLAPFGSATFRAPLVDVGKSDACACGLGASSIDDADP